MRFTVFGKPEGKARARVVRGHAYTPEKTRAYEELVRESYYLGSLDHENDHNGTPYLFPAYKPVKISIVAFYAVPKSASKAMQARMKNNEIAPTIKPDWDNIGKVICDALNGIAWHDDAQVVEASVLKRYGITPMVCVKIEEGVI